MEKGAEKCKKKDGVESVIVTVTTSDDSVTNSSISTSCDSGSSSDNSSTVAQLGWPIRKASSSLKNGDLLCEEKSKAQKNEDESKLKKKECSKVSEIDMMKERFAKLLLGEDMSGNGKGVCPALAISNAITNLCATVFGQLWRLEPLPLEKKMMWQREMGWFLSVSDHIVELIPSWQTIPDGTRLEVMTCRPRADLIINLPALRKLDNMLIDILDGFTNTEFWYVDHGIVAAETDRSVSTRKPIQRQDDKWWLPVPRVPAGGLPESVRRQLTHKRECASQILKAAMSINSIALAEMDVPDTYLETLPKNGRACLGDVIYRYITSEHFSSECLLDCLDLSSEHVALEIANRVEAATFVWRRRLHAKPPLHPNRSTNKSSWEIVKDFMVDGDKRGDLLVERAESLLLCLKQRFPCLTQTTLDATKIQFNKDVGKSILESYSRVLESLSYNIVARIEDLLYVDDINNQSDKIPASPTLSRISHRKASLPISVPVSGTPYRTASTTPNFSPAPLISPARGERTPFINGNCGKTSRRGLGVKRVLTNYLGGDTKMNGVGSVSNRISDGQASRLSVEGKESSSVRKEARSPKMDR